MTTKPPLRLIFVCTGNLCRSPMAEGMLRVKLGVLGLEQGAIIDSAGMHAEVGRSPELFAVELAAESGADIAGLLSRPFRLSTIGVSGCSRVEYSIAARRCR